MIKSWIPLLASCLLAALCLGAQASNTNSDGATLYLTHGETWSAVSTDNGDGAQLAAVGALDATTWQETAQAQRVTQPFVLYDPLLPPDAPEAVAPGDGATDVSTTPLLDWDDAPRAATYDLYGWQSSQTRPASPNVADKTDSQHQMASALLESTSYSWQVTARNLWGETDSPVFGFTTSGPEVPANAKHWTLY